MSIKSLTLKVTTGPYAGKEIDVGSGQSVRIGRTLKSDVATSDPYMSGEHFMVVCDGQGCRIRDLNSRHGTFLNEAKISEAPLQDGDQIYVGQTTLIVQLKET